MNQIFQRFSKIFLVFWVTILPVYSAPEDSCFPEYKGRLTCENLEHLKVYTNDPRFVPFCSDASKTCYMRRQLNKLPETHPLRKQLDSQLAAHLDFYLGFCAVAILKFEPKVYRDQIE
ncbi:MAG: hypothetical protein ACRYGR_09965 [Janthinobacterium lividum]